MVELIYQEFLQRQITSFKEWKLNIKIADIIDKFSKSLTPNQKGQFERLQKLHSDLQEVVEKLLIKFILNLFFCEMFSNH